MIILSQVEETISENFKISVINLIILLTCILTLLYLASAHIVARHKNKHNAKSISEIIKSSGIGIVIIELDSFKIKLANEDFYKLLGFNKDEVENIYNNNFLFLGRSNLFEIIESEINNKNVFNLKLELLRSDGKYGYVFLNGKVKIRGAKKYLHCSIIDIDNIEKNEEERRFNEDRYRIASEVSGDILFEYDVNKDRIVFSSKYYDMFGTSEVIDNYINFLRTSTLISDDDKIRVEELIYKINNENVIQGEFRMRDISGNYVWVQIRGRKVKGREGNYKKIFGKLININNIKIEISKLKEVSEIDALTGLYNKRAITSIVKDLISKKKNITLMIVDIDNFKRVNDTLGHHYGDLSLSDIARKLKQVSEVTFGRYGGDEFMGVCVEDDVEKIKNIAQKINRLVVETYTDDGKVCDVSASIGIAIGSDDYDTIFKKADDALYVTKKNGKNSYNIH